MKFKLFTSNCRTNSIQLKMNNSNDDKTLSIDPIKAFFGPPPPRRPIPSYSFNTLVKIFSVFSDKNQNPFSDFASSADFPEDSRQCADGNQNDPKKLNSGDVQDDLIVARGENKASDELIVPARVEACNPLLHSVANNGVATEDFAVNDSSNGLDVVMGELCQMTNKTKTTEKLISGEKGHDVQMSDAQKVPEALSGIERMVMDELDDMGLSELQEKDIDFNILNDFCSIGDTDVLVDNTVAAESSQTRKLAIEETMEEDVAGEVKRKDAEVNRSITECHVPNSQICLPTNHDISNQERVKNRHTGTSFESSQNKDKRLCKEKDAKKLLESEGLTFTGLKSKNGGLVSIGSSIENVGKENKSDIGSRGETAKAKNASLKDVKSGKRKHISVNGEAFNSKRSGVADPLIQGNMVKQYVRRSKRESNTEKVETSQPESSKGFRYTREQLLHVRNVSMGNGCALKSMAFVSGDIAKALQEISVDIVKGQLSSAGVTTDISGANTEKQGSPAEANLAKENQMDSSVVKNNKRGSTSEARKEKKKRLKRKKRAEMNKKLGVKRLKLKPVLKPKVVQPCRHYLNGRCQQGETCNFSHDLIPLTKSKPCCHFARNACMKGKDCPYDHQLSKYPCKNFVDTGFCIRGASCSFSHKASAAEVSKIVSGSSKIETNSLLKNDESKSKNQLNASFTTPNSLEDSTKQTSLPAIAPKGMSFLSFGKSSVEHSAKHKETELFQQRSGDTPGTCASPKITVGTASRRNDDGPSISSQLNRGISSRSVNVSQTKGNLAPISPKEIDQSSSSGLSNVSSGAKSQATFPTNEQTNPQIRGQGNANDTDKLKAVIQAGSPTSLGQCSTNVGGAKSKQSSAQKALLSTLAFASKFESGIKMTSAAPFKEHNKDGSTTSNSGHNGEPKASAILDFLYSGVKKEK